MKVGDATVINRGRGSARAVRAEVLLGKDHFVNFNGDWEWHRLGERGYPAGLEKFMGYVRDPAMVAVLDRAFLVPAGAPENMVYRFPLLAPAAPANAERDALVGAYFSPGAAAKREAARLLAEEVWELTTGYAVARPERRRLS